MTSENLPFRDISLDQLLQINHTSIGNYAKQSKENYNSEAVDTKVKKIMELPLFFNPVRFAILSILYYEWKIASSDLRSRLGVSWGNFLSNVKKLSKVKIINYTTDFVEGQPKKVVSLTLHGLRKFKRFKNLMCDISGT